MRYDFNRLDHIFLFHYFVFNILASNRKLLVAKVGLIEAINTLAASPKPPFYKILQWEFLYPSVQYHFW